MWISGIGEVLEGNELRNSGLKLHFKGDIVKEDVCDLELKDSAVIDSFKTAVSNQVRKRGDMKCC